MFGRRHRPQNPPLTSSTANPSAATAALSAFKRRDASPSLSSAAAAAALKARPHTPTNVAEVQTKRTLRRSASISSNGTSELGARPGLQRRGSSGSMTERTFRSPSPRRPQSSGSLGQGYSHTMSSHDMPPVPSIPKDVAAKQHRKSKSLGLTSPPFRVASQKLRDGQGSWFGGAAVGEASNVRTSDAAMAIPSSPVQNDGGRPSSRSSSINFSYPARIRVGSPPASPRPRGSEPHYDEPVSERYQPSPRPTQPRKPQHKAASSTSSTNSAVKPRPSSVSSVQSLVYDPNSRRMIPRAELLLREREIIDASEKRPRKKKPAAPKTGSHLAQGTVARTHGTAVPEGQFQQQVSPPPERRETTEPPISTYSTDGPEMEEPAVKAFFPTPRTQQKPEAYSERSRNPISPSNYLPEVDTSHDEPLDMRPTLGKRPSTVNEEPEWDGRQSYESGAQSQNVFDALDAIPMRHSIFEAPQQRSADEDGSRHIYAPTPIAISSPVELPTEVAPELEDAPSHELIASAPEPRSTQAVKAERTHSNSPARNAHFGTVHDSLTVRHSPPPRSVSPRKSALKQRSPSRGASPSDDGSEASASRARPRDEPPLPRKKAVRVSFDDQNTVVVKPAASPDQTESPIIPSPQAHRRPWYSNIGLGKKKDIVPLEDDEVMKPRPALPSFGSVREKKQPKELEERPLVRPLDQAYSPSLPDSPLPMPSILAVTEEQNDEQSTEPLEQSSDHAIGSLLAQDLSSQNAANISRFREPLPPVVTSIEGHTYVSDSSSNSDSDTELIADTPVLPREDSQFTSQATTIPESESADVPLNGSTAISDKLPVQEDGIPEKAAKILGLDESAAVPAISITHPSQERLVEARKERKPFLHVPGTFPEDESDSSISKRSEKSSTSKTPDMAEVHTTPSRQVTFEPVSQQQDMAHTPHTPATVPATPAPIIEEESEDSDSSIYSDAYEDLSDAEGDGFLSLDAVVESPIATSVSKSPFGSSNSTPQQAKQERPQPAQPALKQIAPKVPEDTPPQRAEGGDWEKAKSYWRSLTADKRAQLEREAMDDAAVDADLEEPTQPKKPRRKKSVEKRAAEKKVIEIIHAHPERTYMIKPGTKVEDESASPALKVLRTSLRGPQAPRSKAVAAKPANQIEEAPRMRRSMRTDDNTPPAAQPRPRPVVSKAARPLSFPPPGTEAPRGHGRTMSDNVTPPQQAPGKSSFFPTLRRKGSDSSESSFRRSRPQQWGFMVEPSPPVSIESGQERSKRFSLRSLSPAGSPFRRSSTTHTSPPVSIGMRTTLRDSGAPKQAKSGGMHMPSFGRTGGSKLGQKSKPKSSSRFGDSSDEDDGPSGFRSRFEDSSDEDTPAIPPIKLAPLNTKTMRTGTKPAIKSPPLPEEVEEAEDSPNLPDSDDENATETARPVTAPALGTAKPNTGNKNIGTTTIRRSRSGRGELSSPTTAAPIPPPNNRRGSLMSVLRRKKTDGDKIQRSDLLESAARRDTKLERSPQELEAARTQSLRQYAGSPRLQKRVASMPSGVGRADSWPLPEPEPEAESEPEVRSEIAKEIKRPATSGTLTGSSRPGVLQRRSLSQGVIGIESVGSPASDKPKKKRNGWFRKIFKRDE